MWHSTGMMEQSIHIYDNACSVVRFMQSAQDPATKRWADEVFGNVLFLVDRFHSSKHKDALCSEPVNEADRTRRRSTHPGHPKMLDEDGRPLFNTSRAESDNVWRGGFHSMVRAMATTQFEFFFDVIFSFHNEILVDQLERDGKAPAFEWYAWMGEPQIEGTRWF
jgi:hypothetical protein